MTNAEKADLIQELVKAIVPEVTKAVLEEIKQNQDGSEASQDEKPIDYAALVKEAMK